MRKSDISLGSAEMPRRARGYISDGGRAERGKQSKEKRWPKSRPMERRLGTRPSPEPSHVLDRKKQWRAKEGKGSNLGEQCVRCQKCPHSPKIQSPEKSNCRRGEFTTNSPRRLRIMRRANRFLFGKSPGRPIMSFCRKPWVTGSLLHFLAETLTSSRLEVN